MTWWHGRARPAATVVRSSPRPSAPSAIVNAIDAIIAWKSDSKPESSAATGLFRGGVTPGGHRVDARFHRRPRATSAGDSDRAANSSRIAAASSHRPSIQIRFAARRVAHWCAPSAPSSPIARKHLLGLGAAAEQEQVHRPHRKRLGRSGRSGRGGEAVGQVEIQQRHRVLRGLQVQLRIGGRSDSSASRARRTVACMSASASVGKPLGQPAADLRQVHLARARPPELAVQRMRQAGHEVTAGPLDGDQVHLLGALEIAPSDQIAQHVDGQRFALRQGVDDERHFRVSSCSCLPTMSLMLCDTATSPSHIQTPAIIRIRPAATWSLTQLVQEQRVSAGELPEPSRTAGVHGTAEGGLDHAARGVDGQRLQVQAGEQAVLPQRGDRVRRFVPARNVTTRRAPRLWAS